MAVFQETVHCCRDSCKPSPARIPGRIQAIFFGRGDKRELLYIFSFSALFSNPHVWFYFGFNLRFRPVCFYLHLERWAFQPLFFLNESRDTKSSRQQISRILFGCYMSPLFWVGQGLNFAHTIHHKGFEFPTQAADPVEYIQTIGPE